MDYVNNSAVSWPYMLNRTASHYLTDWSTRVSRKPLVIRGARQVGKTKLVESWAALNNFTLLKIDFEKEPELAARFKSGVAVSALLDELFLLKKIPFAPERTLLFLDEIDLHEFVPFPLLYLWLILHH